MSRYFFYTLLVSLLIACTPKVDNALMGVNLPESFTMPEKYSVISVPLASCEGCVKFLLDYANEKAGVRNINFILSLQGTSKKKLRNSFAGKDLNQINNVFVDHSDSYLNLGIGDSYYPTIYLVEAGEVVKIIKLEGSEVSQKVFEAEVFLTD